MCGNKILGLMSALQRSVIYIRDILSLYNRSYRIFKYIFKWHILFSGVGFKLIYFHSCSLFIKFMIQLYHLLSVFWSILVDVYLLEYFFSICEIVCFIFVGYNHQYDGGNKFMSFNNHGIIVLQFLISSIVLYSFLTFWLMLSKLYNSKSVVRIP